MAEIIKRRRSGYKEGDENYWECFDPQGNHVGNIFEAGTDGWGWELIKHGQVVRGGTVGWQTEAYRKIEESLD